MFDALARFTTARRRLVLILAVVFVAVAGMVGGPVAGLLDTGAEDFEDPSAEAVLAAEDIERATGASASPDVIALVRGTGNVPRVTAVLEADEGVALVNRGAASRDGQSAYVLAWTRNGADEEEVVERLERAVEPIGGVTLGGRAVAAPQVGEQVSEDLAKAEMLAFPLLFLFSLFVFRGVVAALLPLAVGMMTVLGAFLMMRGVDAVIPMSIYALNLIIGLGLGLAIDYSLFVVSRFREEMERGLGTADAIRRTLATAGRTVLFSAVTVAAALASLIVFPQRFLYSMGIGGALVALAAAAVSLTVLPALLAVLGPRVNALSLKRWQTTMHRDAAAVKSGFWYRLSHWVMRRAVPVALATSVLLIALGIPFLRIEFTGVDASVLPESASGRVVDDALRRDFPPSGASSVIVAVRAPEDAQSTIEGYADRLAEVDGVVDVRPQWLGGMWRIDLIPAGETLGDQARAVVREVREVQAPFPVRVGGETAGFLDLQSSLQDRLPLALAILCTTTLILLFLMTGSVVLPIKALIMNLLTLSAAFGLLVLIFQDGRFEGLLDYTTQGALESTQPILLFAVAFGLSTDYGVFLLTRIKEARDGGLSNTEAVAVGLERTGRIVTFAALLFSIAMGAFATSSIIFIKELGVGTVLAVLIDATIVRALLVPSLMKLLGEWNWWAPRPLARLHARIGLSEG
jgi:RND superfamily putative drug exporter